MCVQTYLKVSRHTSKYNIVFNTSIIWKILKFLITKFQFVIKTIACSTSILHKSLEVISQETQIIVRINK